MVMTVKIEENDVLKTQRELQSWFKTESDWRPTSLSSSFYPVSRDTREHRAPAASIVWTLW